jgi:hypothetical protein
MRKHDAHVREFRLMLLKKHYPIPNTVLFLFILFLVFVGFYLGHSYAILMDELFTCLK